MDTQAFSSIRNGNPDGGDRCPIRLDARGWRHLLGVSLCLWVSLGKADDPVASPDLSELSLEQLMNLEVYSASKFPQKKIDAPAAVTIITAQDIQDYGYRTLGDILQSIRGLSVSYDRNYTYLGVNGFGRPGDYNPRILLLIDGYRTNEVIYDQASLGTDFYLDPLVIDRVEFVPGPGSAVYGSNAFFGVVNVITKDGKGMGGPELVGRVASYGTDNELIQYGKHFDNGLDLAFSGARYDSRGQNLYFPEFDAPATNSVRARGLDHDHAERLFGKASWKGFTLEAAYVDRKKEIPTASFGTVFNGSPNYTRDTQAFFDLRYNADPRPDLSLSARAYHGRSDLDGRYLYDYRENPEDPADLVTNRDQGTGRWWGTEFKLVSTYFTDHKLVMGGEYQDNWQQDQRNFDIDPHFLYLDSKIDSYRYGLYAQDDFHLFDPLTLNVGVRYDRYSLFGSTVNPRAALIYKPVDHTAVKLLYGTAFRAPNVYEMFYTSSGESKDNPDLKPEKIRTYELVLEHQPTPNLRLTTTGFRNEISDLIGQIEDPNDGMLVYQNVGEVEMWGATAEAEYRWDSGLRVRGSYAWLRTRDGLSGDRIVNSPTHLIKLNASMPIWQERFRAGLSVQYTSQRLTYAGSDTDDYTLVDFTLRTDKLFTGYLKGFEVSASVYNLLDADYATVGGEEHTMNVIPQDGTNFRVQMGYRF